MNLQKNQRPVAPTGYPSQYPSNAFVMTPGVAPQYQYRPASYPYGQSQYIQSQHIQTPQRQAMATNQPHLIHSSQHAGPSTVAPGQTVIIRKRNNPEPMLNSGLQAKKKRALDRNIPEKLDTLVPESCLYTELQGFERRLDATIMRKRLEIQEMIGKPMKIKRTLRVFISNTAINQNPVPRDGEGNELDFDDGNVPAWILRIEGRLLDPQNTSKTPKPPSRKFSTFFNSIVVELERDPEMYPEGNIIEWNKTHNNTEGVDGFEIKRKGDSNVKCKIFLNLDQQPRKYKLSDELAEMLDVREETKAGIIMALWQYIKHHNLQDSEDKRIINNDARLEVLFNCTRMAFPQIPELVNRHLQPIDPISIDYTIRIDKEFHQSRYAYDIEIELDDPNKARLASIITNTVNQREIQNLDDKIVQCVQSINNSKTKRDFLLNFAKSPVEFINKWVASQSRDLEVILGESKVNLEEQRRSEFYKQSWVNEAVFHYATAQTQRKMHELLGGSSNIRNEFRR
jgi:SWI/SNF-related matrix-associated actin-dependent regulator of chromatin subfamily D